MSSVKLWTRQFTYGTSFASQDNHTKKIPIRKISILSDVRERLSDLPKAM